MPWAPLAVAANGEQAADPVDVKVSVPVLLTANLDTAAEAVPVKVSLPVAAAANRLMAAVAELVNTVPVAPLPVAAKGARAALPEQLNASDPVPDAANGEHAAEAMALHSCMQFGVQAAHLFRQRAHFQLRLRHGCIPLQRVGCGWSWVVGWLRLLRTERRRVLFMALLRA